jgi:hypothetical protein
VLASDKGPSSGVTVTFRLTLNRPEQPLKIKRLSARINRLAGRANGLFCKADKLNINKSATAPSYDNKP